MNDKRVFLNANLSMTPADPNEAENYPALYKYWEELSSRLDDGDLLTDDEFRAWDEKVRDLLRPLERIRFQKALRPHIPISSDTIQYARIFHFTRILWARQGAEKFLKDTDG